MPDDPTTRGPQDRSRINTHEPWELRWWSDQFGVPPDRLKEIVQEVGPAVTKVQEVLQRRTAS